MQRPWNNHSPLRRYRHEPCVTFAPLAWLKLQYFCHAGPTEIGGFGLTSADDLLYVEDFVTVRQRVSAVSVHFDDEAVADFFDQCVDRHLPTDRFARLWCHTHPAASVTPSTTDEETFARSFGRCDWAVMFILGRSGKTYARLAFTVGPCIQREIPTTVDWTKWPDCLADPQRTLECEVEEWRQEYATHVHRFPEPTANFPRLARLGPATEGDPWPEHPWSPELDIIRFEPVKEMRNHDSDDRPRAS
jgi:hypothetical protein